jgi:hypothetical protein
MKMSLNTRSSWADYLDALLRAAPRSPRLATARDRLIGRARGILKLPLVKRVYRFDDIGRHRTWLDGRARPLKEPMHSIFALAMSDHGTNQLLAAELPLMAAAARLTGDRRLLQRLHDQLHEMASWSPLQRPGWCAFGDRLPPDGKDGNWLATGTGVRAIADTLEILGRENVPSATVARLDQLLAAEIVSIVDDWTAKRPWFIFENMPGTNQWVLPTEGLIRACLVLGRERHKAAYELGVTNLFAHLNGHGSQGAFEEGIHYADFTLLSLMSVARAMALTGDRRAINHPFLRHFPVWAVQHFQPGGFIINAFDAFSAARGNRSLLKATFAMAAVSLASREAVWALDHLTDGPDDSLAGLASRMLSRHSLRPPRTFAAYNRAVRVNWRSSWDAKATGVWVRGGDRLDAHDHPDRGHVNVILQGRPLFIEAGTPAYHNARMRSDYASGRGHNVLQLGEAVPSEEALAQGFPLGWQKIRAIAPITVRRLDARGGNIVVNGTAGYDGLKRWRRHVVWNIGQVTVEDSVQMVPAQPQVVLFRWHLGLTRNPRILADGNGAHVLWPGIRVSIAADAPLDMTIEQMPDHTLQYRAWDDKRPDHLHACLVVKTTIPVQRYRMTTQVMSE